MSNHLADGFFDDALHRPAPARVKPSYSVPTGIDQNDRQTVRGLDGKQQTGSGSDQAISNELFHRGRVNTVNDIRMNLPQCDQRPNGSTTFAGPLSLTRYRPQRAKKSSTVALH